MSPCYPCSANDNVSSGRLSRSASKSGNCSLKDLEPAMVDMKGLTKDQRATMVVVVRDILRTTVRRAQFAQSSPMTISEAGHNL
ncbi:hypothetical protein ZWY2020_020642 [Hordeum vulgare]|nr:hypothetical protein ZWY2020_020642 [Hordeum vulgare]